MRFKHLPVHSALDATKDFEQLQQMINNGEISGKTEDRSPASAYRSSTQKIKGNVFTRVKLNKEIFDPFENEAEHTRSSRTPLKSEGADTVNLPVVALVKAAKGDKIELRIFQLIAAEPERELSLGSTENRLDVITVGGGTLGEKGEKGSPGAAGAVFIKTAVGPFESTKAVSAEPTNTELFLTNEITLESETLVTVWAKLEAAKGTEEAKIWLFLDGTAVQTPKGSDYVNGNVAGFAEGVYKWFMIADTCSFVIQGAEAAVPVFAEGGSMLMAAGTHKVELRGQGKKGLYKNLKLVVKVG